MKDLGVMIDSKLDFKAHRNQIITRAKCALAFVKRTAKDFECPYVTRSLYFSLVRPTLEYCSVVWCPFFNDDTGRIESVQKQFMLFALRYLNWNGGASGFELPPYEARLSLLGMQSLESRRALAACSVVASCLNGEIKSVELASNFIFQQPMRVTRASCVPKLKPLPPARARYLENSPIRRCIAEFNRYAHLYSPSMSTMKFKNAILAQMVAERRNLLSTRFSASSR